ncbi:hypothetical protein GT347_11780 [Xylophilus rhododendri]|uniref:histidine kinase n=1 Tax=Xylophilus rhododendri TaxID=2697032 RepID=A0A857J753_9BURK|nr:sensor histidine kinase [Xylophilus rhododendri]QHI98618.1 hypothetical protein GT347_11780 [Xylophilus rhododendri]
MNATRGGRFSLRSKLLTPLLWLWVASALTAALTAFWLTGRSAGIAFDRILQDDAVALAAQIRWDEAGPRFSADSRTASSLVYDSFAPSHFTVRTDGGRLLAGNAELALPADARPPEPEQALFFEEQTLWGRLRLVAIHIERAGQAENVWVVVGESLAKRSQLSSELAEAIFLPAAALGFIILPLIWLGVRAALAPAQAISAAIERRGIDDLSPLPLAGVPDELRGMVQHTNDLLARLATAVAHERSFISDAAHQLRTPVAGIKLLVEDLRRTRQADPRQPPDAEVLDILHDTATRATRLVRQLLVLARAGAAGGTMGESTDLRPLLRETIERMQAAARAAGKTLLAGPGLRLDGPASVLAVPLLLEEAVSNVVDNALRYGGPRIEVDLMAVAGPPAAWDITVLDDGPALDEATRRQMAAPFWRAPDAQTEGSGLGLAIVDKALRQMRGSLLMPEAPPGGGTRIRLRLQAADAQNSTFHPSLGK